MRSVKELKPKPVKMMKLLDYIDLSIGFNYMLWVLITSGAEGKLKGLGFDAGMGKSTRALNLMATHIYAGDWEKVKANTIGAYWELKPILDRKTRTNGVLLDDMQNTLGKDKQHNPEIKELAYYMTTVRPYIAVFLATASHRGQLHKDFREMFHFEIIIPTRGRYEVQQLKRLIDFKKPQRVKERLRFRGKGRFPKLPYEIEKWYSAWRHKKNMEIRGRLKAFKDEDVTVKLVLGQCTIQEKTVLDYIVEKGFVRYETLQRKGLSLLAMRLRRRGWLEVDRNRRFQLTMQAEEVLMT